MASDPEWRYFSEALAWYPSGHAFTGAQVMDAVNGIRSALKDGRITPADLGMVRLEPASANGLIDAHRNIVWGFPLGSPARQSDPGTTSLDHTSPA